MLPSQAPEYEVTLANGSVLGARAIDGEPGKGIEIAVGEQRRHLEPGELLVVSGVPVRPVDLPVAYLAGGQSVRGALVSGSASGDRFELQSPVLGRVALSVDDLVAFAPSSAVPPASLRLPQGVSEALFQRAAVGYDVVTGVLHQFGEQGIRFQPEGADAPRWFGLGEFVALRLAEGEQRPPSGPVDIVTRTGDRLRAVVRRFAGDSVHCERDGSGAFVLRLADVASLSFVEHATFLSDLQPKEVRESGFDGEVVHGWRRDASAVGGPLLVAGRTHGKGLGVHARSRLVFAAPSGAASFRARVGIDDSSVELGVAATADVRVWIGDVVRFEAKGLAPGGVRDTGILPVKAGDHVTLEADFGRGRDIGDRVDWLSPMFLPAAGRRP